jgi:putative salt-induced outer membrane protein YdiY
MTSRSSSNAAVRFAALVTLTAGAAPANAIVSMEDLHLGSPAPGFSGAVDGYAAGASGNTDKSDFGAGARLQWQADRTTDFLLLRYSYGRSRGLTDTNKSFAHLRHIDQWTPRWAWEGFGQAETDEFARLEFRGLIGGGVRRTLSGPTEQHAAYLGTGAFFVRETISDQAGSTDAGTDRAWRANIYLVLKYRVDDRIGVVSSTYYQPDLGQASDYRLLESATLEVGLSERLALDLSIDIAHDSRPPQGVERTDVRYRTGLSYSF